MNNNGTENVNESDGYNRFNEITAPHLSMSNVISSNFTKSTSMFNKNRIAPKFSSVEFTSSIVNVVKRMQTFKQFVLTLDDNAQPDSAIEKYIDYIAEFSQTQIEPFFQHYKKYHWFELRYHPVWSKVNAEFVAVCAQHRLVVFNQLMDFINKNEMAEYINLNSNNVENVRLLLLMVNILLEDGSVIECNEILNDFRSKSGENFVVHSPDSMFDFDKNKSNFDDDFESLMDKSTQSAKNLNSDVFSLCANSPKYNKYKTNCVCVRAVDLSITAEHLHSAYSKTNNYLRSFVSEPEFGRTDIRRAFVTFANDEASTITDTVRELSEIPVVFLNNNSNQNENEGEIDERTKMFASITFKPQVLENVERNVKVMELQRDSKMDKSTILFDLNIVKSIILYFDDTIEPYRKVESFTEVAEENESSDKEPGFSMPHAINLLKEEYTNKWQYEELVAANPIITEIDEAITSLDEGKIKKILDKSVLFLRVVYSVDYYGLSTYSYEDLRPSRCCCITVRKDADFVAEEEKEKYSKQINNYKHRIELNYNLISIQNKDSRTVDFETAATIGLQDDNTAIERYIEENTEKLGEGRYLCKLSNKKFKSPEYVKKHVLSKHGEKLVEVRENVEYFNKFLLDKTRYMPMNLTSLKMCKSTYCTDVIRNQQISVLGVGKPANRSNYSGGGGGFRRNNNGGQGGRKRFYRDWDAAED